LGVTLAIIFGTLRFYAITTHKSLRGLLQHVQVVLAIVS
jgi:hypothetical protein